MAFNSVLLPAPCRLCGGPTWLTDELGAIHPCCELSGRRTAEGEWGGCLSCRTSEQLNRNFRERKLTKNKIMGKLSAFEDIPQTYKGE